MAKNPSFFTGTFDTHNLSFSFFTAFINSSKPTKWFSIEEFGLRSVNFQKFLTSKMKFVQQDNYLHIVLAHTVELGKPFLKHEMD